MIVVNLRLKELSFIFQGNMEVKGIVSQDCIPYFFLLDKLHLLQVPDWHIKNIFDYGFDFTVIFG